MKQFFLGILLLFSVTSLSAQEKWIYWTSYEAGKTKLSRLKMATRQVEVVKDSVGFGFDDFAVDVKNEMIYSLYSIYDLGSLTPLGYFNIIPEDWYQYEGVVLDRSTEKVYREIEVHNSAVGADPNPYRYVDCFDATEQHFIMETNELRFGNCNGYLPQSQFYNKNIVPDGQGGYFFQGRYQNGVAYEYYIGYKRENGVVETIFPKTEMQDFTVYFNNRNRTPVFYFIKDGKIFRQDKNSTTPELFFGNTQNPQDLTLDINGNKIYWIENHRICRANLDGTGFEVIVKDLNAPIAMALSFDQNYTVATEQEEVPSAVEAVSVFPNPFQQEATFSYELKQESNVKLSIFDVLGREIAILVDAPQGIGTYKINWKDSASSAGMYIWRLKTKNNVQQGSFVKVK